MVGEQQDPEKEQRRLSHARMALGILNSHVIDGGPGELTLDQLWSLVEETVEEDGPEKAVLNMCSRLATGLNYVAWELLALREAEVGKTPTESLQELGRTFNP
ncbi:hypothetical protein BST43_06560 [Mycobacteroides saopaulense]|uniref:Uncharacterized protein n=1 Tax=Mycobacteroides saopaulense TaxID=1578165 RepID=A0A1X0JA57_9MYCO|nr:hypothetical protein [Mycobacteroides saopaulense]ORB59654.1 hypothetical protein BST43_06560 [Mycobacteroides saopaulense]